MIAGALRVVDAGFGTTLQDLGRHGWAHLGVPTAGAVDRPAQRVANRLVGNAEDAATFETRVGLVLEALRPLIVGSSQLGVRQILQVGEQLQVDQRPDAMWSYVAVRGGIAVEPVLGSRSHDTLSSIGPTPVAAGTIYDIGDDPGSDFVTEHAPRRRADPVVRIWEGPQAAWFTSGPDALTRATWTVSRDVSRVGVRLAPGRFERVAGQVEQMPSQGLVEGAIQITPAGEPIVMLADHPTTGGYPVIAVVEPDDISIVAQAPPGSTLRFRRA